MDPLVIYYLTCILCVYFTTLEMISVKQASPDGTSRRYAVMKYSCWNQECTVFNFVPVNYAVPGGHLDNY